MQLFASVCALHRTNNITNNNVYNNASEFLLVRLLETAQTPSLPSTTFKQQTKTKKNNDTERERLK